jgi:hypothetical protein
MTAMLGAGGVFLLRHWRGGLRSDLVLAGVGLGIGFGTKWYAVPAVVVVLAVWAAASVVDRRRLRLVAAQGGTLVGLVLLAGGFWLIRNWVVSGNPVEPVRVTVLGQTVFDAPVDVLMKCAGYTILDYLGSPNIWRHFFFPAWRQNYALPGLVALLGVLLTLAIVAFDATRRGLRAARSADGTAVAVLLCALLLALVYAKTPYTAYGPKDNPILTGANTRYLIPALMAAVPLSAWAAGRLRYGPEVFALLAAAATVQGLYVSVDVPPSKLALGAVLLAGVVVLVLVLLATRRLGDRGAAARVALLVACALGLVAAGQVRQRKFNRLRYETSDPVVTWVSRHAPSGHRVALAGVWGTGVLSPVLPAFGPRLGNEVRYNGVFYKGRLQEYATRPAWAKAIRRGHYDLLVVGRGGYSARHCGGVVIPGSESDDDAWARAEGFRQVVQSQHLTLYRIPPRPG